MALKKLSSYGDYNTDEEKARLLPLISPEELATALGAKKIGDAPNFTEHLIRGEVELLPIQNNFVTEPEIQHEIFSVSEEIISQIIKSNQVTLIANEIFSSENTLMKRKVLVEKITKEISLSLGEKINCFKHSFNQKTNKILIVLNSDKNIVFRIKLKYENSKEIKELANTVFNKLQVRNDFHLFNKFPFLPSNSEIGNVKNPPEKKLI